MSLARAETARRVDGQPTGPPVADHQFKVEPQIASPHQFRACAGAGRIGCQLAAVPVPLPARASRGEGDEGRCVGLSVRRCVQAPRRLRVQVRFRLVGGVRGLQIAG